MKLAYRAFDKTGKVVEAQLDASNEGEAHTTLRARGLYIETITAVDQDGTTAATPPVNVAASDSTTDPRCGNSGPGATSTRTRKTACRVGNGRRLKNLVMFTRQLFVMTSTGTQIVPALESLERQAQDEDFKATIGRLCEHVERGAPLSEAMAAQPHYFDQIYTSLVNAGESAGKLPTMLDRLSDLTRRKLRVRGAVIGAMVYPLLLTTVSVCVLVLILVAVLPQFAGLFDGLGVPLPATTVALMMVSNFLIAYWWLASGVAIVTPVLLLIWKNTASGKRRVDRLVLRIPKFGPLVRDFASARLARLMGILMNSHLPLLDVLDLIRQSTVNTRYLDLLQRAEHAITKGEMISSAFSDTTIVTPAVYEAMRSGEESGQIASSLMNVADFLDEDNEQTVRTLSTLIEPIILITLGVLVALIAVSMFLPMFDLTAMAGGG